MAEGIREGTEGTERTCQSLARQDIPRHSTGTPLGVSPPAGGDTSPPGALGSREDVRPHHRKGPCAFTAPTQAAPAQQLSSNGGAGAG